VNQLNLTPVRVVHALLIEPGAPILTKLNLVQMRSPVPLHNRVGTFIRAEMDIGPRERSFVA
jgi:hypothetical protein